MTNQHDKKWDKDYKEKLTKFTEKFMENQQKGWEEEFDKQFPKDEGLYQTESGWIVRADPKKLKQFISNLLTQKANEVVASIGTEVAKCATFKNGKFELQGGLYSDSKYLSPTSESVDLINRHDVYKVLQQHAGLTTAIEIVKEIMK